MLDPRAPLVLGHRGSPSRAVENTLASFAAALDEGAAGVECDVWLSRDRVPVVFHDATAQRLCGRAEAIELLTLREIRKLTFAGTPAAAVPTLDEFCGLVARRGALALIELKGEPLVADEAVDGAMAAIRRAGIAQNSALISFSHAVHARVRAANLQIAAAPIFEFAPPLDALPAGATWVVLPADCVDDEVASRFARAGITIVCYGVDDPATDRRLDAQGVGIRISNHPGILLRARDL